MTAEEVISLAETTKEAMVSAYESEDKTSGAVLARALAALVTAVATQVGSSAVSGEQALAFKVA